MSGQCSVRYKAISFSLRTDGAMSLLIMPFQGLEIVACGYFFDRKHLDSMAGRDGQKIASVSFCCGENASHTSSISRPAVFLMVADIILISIGNGSFGYWTKLSARSPYFVPLSAIVAFVVGLYFAMLSAWTSFQDGPGTHFWTTALLVAVFAIGVLSTAAVLSSIPFESVNFFAQHLLIEFSFQNTWVPISCSNSLPEMLPLFWVTSCVSICALQFDVPMGLFGVTRQTEYEWLKPIPPLIRAATHGVGGAKTHALPYGVSAPGNLSGTVSDLARDLGTGAPIFMIGRVGFGNERAAPYPAASGHFSEPTTAFSIQGYNWTQNVVAVFLDRISMMIIVLIVPVLLMNAVAMTLCHRFERHW